jgi:RNA polymerase sigma factor (sigma-70 family)
MHELDDSALLRQYAEQNSEEAFAALVTRHIDRVYSVALRHTGNPHQAEEITQAVFVILARKSNRLSKHVILEGWLYETARLTAITFIRSEIRRARREQEAYMQNILNENEADVWPQIAPLLDSGLAGLNETDRQAVVLRFFYGKSMKEIGTALGGNEDMARMRINRALEKLRKFFTKRGIASTTAILTAAISANSVQAAPMVLAKSVTAVAIVKGSIASVSTLTLVKETMRTMTSLKLRFAIGVGLAMILAAGTATTLVAQHESQPNAAIPYKVVDDAFQFADSFDQTKLVVRVLISSKNKALHPADISLTIQSAVEGPVTVQLGTNGQLLDFPHKEELRSENPLVIANIPKGTLNFSLVSQLPMLTNLTFRYSVLGDGVAEANIGAAKANKIMKADYAGQLSPFPQTVQGVIFRFPKSSAGKAKVEIESAAGSREYTADAKGQVILKLEQSLLAENPEVKVSERPRDIVPNPK